MIVTISKMLYAGQKMIGHLWCQEQSLREYFNMGVVGHHDHVPEILSLS